MPRSKEEMKAYNKEYQERIKKRRRDDPEFNAECIANQNHRQTEWRKQNPTKVQKTLTKSKQKRWAKQMVYNSKNADIKAKREFSIDDYIDVPFLHSQFDLQKGKCAYCDSVMAFGEGVSRNRNPLGMTVERKNNQKPHTRDNCLLVDISCNFLSSTVGHRLMCMYGPYLRLGVLEFCGSTYHVGDRIMPQGSMFPGTPGHECRACGSLNRRLAGKRYRDRKRAEKLNNDLSCSVNV